MPSTIDLREKSYKNNVKQIEGTKKISQIIDEIVYFLVSNHSKLITAVETNNMPKKLLIDEIDKYITKNKIIYNDAESYKEIVKQVTDYLWGYGLLQPLIEDDEISDIKVISINNVRIKRKGRRGGTDIKFTSEKSLMNYCYLICIKNQGNLSEINAIQKLSDAHSQEGALLRINVCIEPVNQESPSIHIRKMLRKKYTLEDLLNEDMYDLDMYLYIKKCIKSGLNIIWTGKGASGKTTLMNSCLEEVPHTQSQIIIQESEELLTKHPDTISQKLKRKTGESDIEYSLRELTVNALLMDMDRVVIGEIKGEEAMEFFNAVYTGSIGWTSVHSPSAKQCLNKTVHLMKYSNTDLSRTDLLEMLSEVDVIFFMKNFKCAEVFEIDGFDYEKNEVVFNPMYEFVTKKAHNGVLEGFFIKTGTSCDKINKKFSIVDNLE